MTEQELWSADIKNSAKSDLKKNKAIQIKREFSGNCRAVKVKAL